MTAIRFAVGDCLDVFGAEPDASFDAFVSDWPAGVAFMSRAWDRDHGGRDAWVRVWAERAAMMKRKAKPGAFSLTWALPRTSHWTATALEDGGWIVQDVMVHVFGQGWPKGKSALKPASEHWILARNGSGGALQIDAARVARGDPCAREHGEHAFGRMSDDSWKAKPGTYETPAAGSWPPNFVLSHCPECEERGTRRVKGSANASTSKASAYQGGKYGAHTDHAGFDYVSADGTETVPAFDCLAACDCGLSVLAPAGSEPPRCACGRAMWWACPVAEMDRQSGQSRSTDRPRMNGATMGYGGDAGTVTSGHEDAGGSSRFFPRFSYHAKAAGGERHAGCDDLYWRADKRSPFGFVRVSREEWEGLPDPTGAPDGTATGLGRGLEAPGGVVRARGNVHPTVKSIALMEHLVALVCPPGGRIGDITAGSGGTGIALYRLNEARGLGASFLGSDICPEAVEIADARLAWWRSVRLDTKPVKREQEPAGGPAQLSLARLHAAPVPTPGDLFARRPT